MHLSVRRMDNVGMVVDDLSATIEFFREGPAMGEGRAVLKAVGPRLTSQLDLRRSAATCENAGRSVVQTPMPGKQGDAGSSPVISITATPVRRSSGVVHRCSRLAAP